MNTFKIFQEAEETEVGEVASGWKRRMFLQTGRELVSAEKKPAAIRAVFAHHKNYHRDKEDEGAEEDNRRLHNAVSID